MTASEHALPEGYASRPLTPDDAIAVHAIVVAEERRDLGRSDSDLADITGEWQRPGTDLSTTTIGVLCDDQLVGYAELSERHCFAGVHLDHVGRGLGRWLAQWSERAARAAGHDRLTGQVFAGGPADRLLAARAYDVVYTAWDFELPPAVELPRPELPPGYTHRHATAADHEACWTLFEDAFLEWSERERKSLDDFGATMWLRPGFVPWNLQVVTDPDGSVVAATFVTLTDDGDAYLHKVAVRGDQRGLGLAQVLLAEAFACAREQGARVSRLSTDTRAGARGLYEKVGMVVESTWVNRALPL